MSIFTWQTECLQKQLAFLSFLLKSHGCCFLSQGHKIIMSRPVVVKESAAGVRCRMHQLPVERATGEASDQHACV